MEIGIKRPIKSLVTVKNSLIEGKATLQTAVGISNMNCSSHWGV
jgi:hypothetical protein